MKKELATHFTFAIAFIIFISIFRGWLELAVLPFLVGGILGTILPDVDHLIYAYFLRPHELTSQRVARLIEKREVSKTLRLLAATRRERKHLIFHTVQFNVIFLAFTFLVITSTGSFLGRGIVLTFSLHLLIDQVIDLIETGGLENWFRQVKVDLNKQQLRWYLIANTVALLVFGFLL